MMMKSEIMIQGRLPSESELKKSDKTTREAIEEQVINALRFAVSQQLNGHRISNPTAVSYYIHELPPERSPADILAVVKKLLPTALRREGLIMPKAVRPLTHVRDKITYELLPDECGYNNQMLVITIIENKPEE